jgi:hypothetical protein
MDSDFFKKLGYHSGDARLHLRVIARYGQPTLLNWYYRFQSTQVKKADSKILQDSYHWSCVILYDQKKIVRKNAVSEILHQIVL